MSDSRAPALSRPPLSTLPPELIDDILTQKSLSKSDLARCCLVSHRFLQSSRRALYSSVDCNLLATPGFKKMEIAAFKLLQTLRVSPTARHLVKGLVFDVYDVEYDGDDCGDIRAEAVEVTSFNEIVVEMLDLAPQVTRLALRESVLGKVMDYLYSDRGRWTELDIPDLAIDVGFPTSEGTFNNLTKLSSSLYSSRDSGNRICLPPHLKTLDLVSLPRLVAIENASTSSLRFLRIELKSLVNLPDIAKLPHLQHLSLTAPIPVEDPSTIAEILNPLGGLDSLSLYYFRGGDSTSTYFSVLLRHLCLPIQRLDFDHCAPLADLANLIKAERFKSVRTLGLSKYHVLQGFTKQDLTVLSRVCEDKGISIEYIEPMYTLFG
ncbi:hypothetical protein JCM5350_001352 [Sporobolomyces pararoseus]